MSIVTNGWGSNTIGTWGWGSAEVFYIPEIVATYLEHYAYSCVLMRDYIDPMSRDRGEVLLRVITGESILIRSPGWSEESGEICEE